MIKLNEDLEILKQDYRQPFTHFQTNDTLMKRLVILENADILRA